MPNVSCVTVEKIISEEIAENTTIYDGLHDKGHDLPHGCLAGSCGSCRVEILEGMDNLAPPGAVELDTITSLKSSLNLKDDFPLRLTCRAKIKGAVKIKLLR